MKRLKFSEDQITCALRRHEEGSPNASASRTGRCPSPDAASARAALSRCLLRVTGQIERMR